MKTAQMYQTLSTNSPIMETELKLILKELMNKESTNKLVKKQHLKGNVAVTTTMANTMRTDSATKAVVSAVPKTTASKTTIIVLTTVVKTVKSTTAVQCTDIKAPNKPNMKIKRLAKQRKTHKKLFVRSYVVV